MDKLEQFILDNRESFETAEPSPGHFDRFREKLDDRFGQSRTDSNRSLFLKIAAGFLILVAASVFSLDYAIQWVKDSSGSSASLPSELQEAVNYYDATATEHLNNIQKLACCGQDSHKLYSMASGELKSLDDNSRELTNTLKENPDERVKDALIRSQQMKEEVMKNVIRQMKNAGK
jgi:hypothetical protein